MNELLSFVSMLGGLLALVYLITGAMIWLSHGLSGASFVFSKEFTKARHEWEGRKLLDAESAGARADESFSEN